MSLQRKNSKMGILDVIPVPFLKIMLVFSLILFFLNGFTLVLNMIYKENLPLSIITFIISVSLLLITYSILARNTKKQD